MDRRGIVLAGLAAAGCTAHSPVQVQKLFFLIDRNIPDEIGGPLFDFQPYNYGPFDSDVYSVLEDLASESLVEIARVYTWREYRLTDEGLVRGKRILAQLSVRARSYIGVASAFVRRLSFIELVRAIYAAYPEMRANSVFQD